MISSERGEKSKNKGEQCIAQIEEEEEEEEEEQEQEGVAETIQLRDQDNFKLISFVYLQFDVLNLFRKRNLPNCSCQVGLISSVH